MTDQQAVRQASSQVHIWSLQKAPIPALVVSDVCLHLVIHLLVCQEYPFDTCYLGKRVRDGEPCWLTVLERLQHFPQGAGRTKEKRRNMVRNVVCHVVFKRSLSSYLHPPPPIPDATFPSYIPAFSHFRCSSVLCS